MPKTKKTEVAAEATTKAVKETPVKEEAPRKRVGRRKKVVPNFVIQSSADQSATYDAIVEKVKATFEGEPASLDIYVKAEEGKAYYVINGDVTGDVDLF